MTEPIINGVPASSEPAQWRPGERRVGRAGRQRGRRAGRRARRRRVGRRRARPARAGGRRPRQGLQAGPRRGAARGPERVVRPVPGRGRRAGGGERLRQVHRGQAAGRAGAAHQRDGSGWTASRSTSRSSRRFRQYKRQVQYVFQDPFSSLNPVHTVGYHLTRPVKLHQPEVKDVKPAVIALLEQVRLTPAAQFIGKYPHELSGGQRQRVVVRPGAGGAADRAARRRASVHARRLHPPGDARACSTTCAPGFPWPCCTSPTTSPPPGTSRTRCW